MPNQGTVRLPESWGPGEGVSKGCHETPLTPTLPSTLLALASVVGQHLTKLSDKQCGTSRPQRGARHRTDGSHVLRSPPL